MARDTTKAFLHHHLKREGFNDNKISTILSNIKNLSFSSFKDFNFEDEKEHKLALTDNQKLRLKKIQDDILISNDLRETMVKFLARKSIRTQYENLDSRKLEDLTINPFMVRLLQLRTPEEVVDYFARSNFFISVATSLGFYLEHFLIDGHPNVEKLKKGFDARKTENDVTYEMEFKSGPNDVNKTAMRQYNTDFLKKEKQDIEPRMGFLYGSRDKSMAWTHAKNELDKPDEWVLVGKEIWEFVSGEKNYHSKVMKWMVEAVSTLGFNNKILDQVNLTISRLVKEFEEEFGKGETGVKKYISQSM